MQPVAIVSCVTGADGAEVEVRPLRTAIAELPPEIDLVVLTARPMEESAANALAAGGVPTATAHAGTDAVKRIADGILVETLDRTRLYVLRLPAAVDRHVVLATLDRCQGARCLVADLVAPGRSIPTLVDDEGRPVT
jgi:2-C-methyl-D-erythritol 4-phosphate cytidylyltransferase